MSVTYTTSSVTYTTLSHNCYIHCIINISFCIYRFYYSIYSRSLCANIGHKTSLIGSLNNVIYLSHSNLLICDTRKRSFKFRLRIVTESDNGVSIISILISKTQTNVIIIPSRTEGVKTLSVIWTQTPTSHF